jgi:hypothetical protein
LPGSRDEAIRAGITTVIIVLTSPHYFSHTKISLPEY